MECKAVHYLPISEDDLEPDLKKQKLEIDSSSSSSSVVDEVETSLGKSREERLQMFMKTFGNNPFCVDDDEEEENENGYHSMTFRDFASLRLDFLENGGFDIEEDYSKVVDCGMVIHYYDPTTTKYDMSADDEDFIELQECAQQAIGDYNNKMETHFDNVRVLKANVEPLSPYRYYITFEAHDGTENITQSFQAQIAVRIPTTIRKVELVRIRKPPSLFSGDE